MRPPFCVATLPAALLEKLPTWTRDSTRSHLTSRNHDLKYGLVHIPERNVVPCPDAGQIRRELLLGQHLLQLFRKSLARSGVWHIRLNDMIDSNQCENPLGIFHAAVGWQCGRVSLEYRTQRIVIKALRFLSRYPLNSAPGNIRTFSSMKLRKLFLAFLNREGSSFLLRHERGNFILQLSNSLHAGGPVIQHPCRDQCVRRNLDRFGITFTLHRVVREYP